MSRVIKAQSRRESCPLSVGPVHLADLAAEGKRTILFARRRAASILAEAREEAQLIHQEGDRSGHADGFARGLAEGRQQAAEKATELAEFPTESVRGGAVEIVCPEGTYLAEDAGPAGQVVDKLVDGAEVGA